MRKKVSKATIEEFVEKKHKPLPSFEWRGPLENYYRDGECYYYKKTIVARCLNGGGESDIIYGNGESSKKRALWNLTQTCNCGASWHDS